MKVSPTSNEGTAGNRRAVLIGALAVPAAGLVAIGAPEPGALSLHMAVHIVSMNIAAPIAALWLARRRLQRGGARATPSALWYATPAQLGILWAFHTPALHHWLHAWPAAAVAMHLVLFGAALAFWLAIAEASSHRWHAMLALIVSGKFACMLGVLLVFAPRSVFASGAVHASHAAADASLGDQHLAGMLMLAACPLSYVLTAVVLAVEAVNGFDGRTRVPVPARSLGR
jgi:putative membrane protein